MCFARWTFAEGAQCLLCSFLLFASAVQIRVHKRLLARPLSRNLFEGNWQLQFAIGQSGHGIDIADDDAAEDDDGYGDNDSDDDDDKCFP